MNNYDAEAFISEKLSSKLKEGEKIVWCGCTADGATPKERGHSLFELAFAAGWFAVITYALKDGLAPDFISTLAENSGIVSYEMMRLFMILFFSLFYLAGLSVVFNYFIPKKLYYAVTDRRLYVLKKSGRIARSYPLRNISLLFFKASDRGIGYIKLKKIRFHSTKSKFVILGGIADCEAVYEVWSTVIK